VLDVSLTVTRLLNDNINRYIGLSNLFVYRPIAQRIH